MESSFSNLKFLRSIYYIVILYLIQSSVILADSRDEYQLDSGHGNSEYLSFRFTRDTGTPDDKKSSYKEKKLKPKTSLTATTLPDEKAKSSFSESTTESSPVNSTLDNLPYDTLSNFTGNLTDKEDHHVYYNSTFYAEGDNAMKYWTDMETVKAHPMLSYSHRRAATITLSFDFPFYGYMTRNITIATGGFLYTGDYMHTWLAATQYIAPLMANFDTSIHNDSTIKYIDNGTAFTVQWEDVYLKDKNLDGPFTFQVTLFKSGDIVFVYKKVAVPVTDLDDSLHPVKVGLSDAYIISRVILFIRRKTIYEYHRVNLKSSLVDNNTAIYFTALPTCLSHHNCNDCMSSDLGFKCLWCAGAERCSSGLDRNKQHWIDHTCDELKPEAVTCDVPAAVEPQKKLTTAVPEKTSVPETTASNISSTSTSSTTSANNPDPWTTEETASIHFIPPSVPPRVVTLPNDVHDSARIIPINAEPRVSSEAKEDSGSAQVGAGAVISILLIVVVVSGFAIWIIYAYKFPQSPSGQLLIRYRPSQWRWRHGEARYTAASIHI